MPSTRTFWRCRSAIWPTPPCRRRARAAPATPSCGSSGNVNPTPGCETIAWRARPSGRRPACPSGSSTTAPGASRPRPSCATDAAAGAARDAVELARTSAALRRERIELADEPVYPAGTWISAYDVNPFDVVPAERAGRLLQWTSALLAHGAVDHADAALLAVQENKFYADLAGTTTVQQRVRVHPTATAVAINQETGEFDTMRTLAPPTGRGWEYLSGTGWDWDAGARRATRAAWPRRWPRRECRPVRTTWSSTRPICGSPSTSPSGTPPSSTGRWGTRPPTPARRSPPSIGSARLQYGAPFMHVTGDRTVPHGLASVGWDDEGVAAQSWDLIRDGVLVGYQLDRRMAARQGLGRSNGCAFADSSSHVPLQRMANVSLQPTAGGPTTEELIAAVGDGIYIIGDKSWSIDMQRYNFQFTGQRFYRVRDGRLAGQLRDVAYQGTTTEFWGAMQATGGESTYVLGGAFNCGKGQPGQVAPVSHGSPAALFRQVRVLNAAEESGR